MKCQQTYNSTDKICCAIIYHCFPLKTIKLVLQYCQIVIYGTSVNSQREVNEDWYYCS